MPQVSNGVDYKTYEQFMEMLSSPGRAAQYAELNNLIEEFKMNT